MRKTALYLILWLPLIAIAQQPAAPSQDQMAQMMQRAQEMQKCMQNIDQTAMQAFEDRTQKMMAETKALCAAGQRDAAMKKALEFGKETAANPAMAQMQKCGEGMRRAMPSVMPETPGSNDDETGSLHPCDNLND